MTKKLANKLTPASVSEPRLLCAEIPRKHLRDEGPNWDSAFWAATTDVSRGLKPHQLPQRSEADLPCPSLCSRTTFSDAQDRQQPTQPLERRLPNRSVGVNTDTPSPIPERQSKPSSFPPQTNTETSPCGSSASDDGNQPLDDSESEWGAEGEASACGHYSTVPRDIMSPSIPRFYTSNAEAKRLLSWIIDLRPVAQESLGVAPAAFPADAVGGSRTPSFYNTATPSSVLPAQVAGREWVASGSKRDFGPPREDGDDDGEDRDRKRSRPAVETPMVPPMSQRRYVCPFQKMITTCVWADKPDHRSHVLKEHNPAQWCHHCWRRCKSEEAASKHHADVKCSAAPRNEYLLQDGQAEHIKKWKFTHGTDSERWCSLFKYISANRSISGPDGNMLFTTYHENPTTVSPYVPPPSLASIWGSDTSSNVSRVHQGSMLTDGFVNGDAAEGTFTPRLDVPFAADSPANPLPLEYNNEGQRELAGFVVHGFPHLPSTGGSLAPFPEREDPVRTNGTPMSTAHASGLRTTAVLELQKNNAKLRSEQAQTRSELERCRQAIHDSLEYVDQLSELQESYALDASPEPSPRVLQFGSAVMGLRDSLAPSQVGMDWEEGR
ncbi:hypothetical protein B0H67DRAFT_558109 [Lasiosphaeris hirsuta]|uniref:Uncharacterized protein n=1 Tax=Lasiosphaeris hirsuta TaxID=260670 RepID=A0AA39ZXQ1_9PEZI|nr:hypothetical protein B0H67DRAFT_558109 [Lasiosphaeris hirsuta]